MEVKIRGVSDVAIAKIDALAKKEGVSRNEFLKEQIEYISILDELKNEREKFEFALKGFRISLENSYERLDRMEQGYEKMFMLISLASDISLGEVDKL